MKRLPVDAFHFEDFIDGYVPLALSLRQLVDRQNVGSAFVVLRVTPMMELPGLQPEDPVPLHIDPVHAGLIDWMAVVVRRTKNGAEISGHAHWSWNDPKREDLAFRTRTIRLAEPAFVRGIGFRNGDYNLKSLGAIVVTQEDRGISISSPSPLRFGSENQPEEISWSLSDNGSVVRLSEIRQNAPSTRRSSNFQDCLVLAKNRNPIAERFVSDLLSAVI